MEQWQIEWKDYYKMLGVERNASSEEIKKVFRQKAYENHPDINPNASDDEMKMINEAYGILRKEDKRREYDREYEDRINREKNKTSSNNANNNSNKTSANSANHSPNTSSKTTSSNEGTRASNGVKEEKTSISNLQSAKEAVENLYATWYVLSKRCNFKNKKEYDYYIEKFKEKINNTQMKIIGYSSKDFENYAAYYSFSVKCDELLKQIPSNYLSFLIKKNVAGMGSKKR